jgi:hypothetical protein
MHRVYIRTGRQCIFFKTIQEIVCPSNSLSSDLALETVCTTADALGKHGLVRATALERGTTGHQHAASASARARAGTHNRGHAWEVLPETRCYSSGACRSQEVMGRGNDVGVGLAACCSAMHIGDNQQYDAIMGGRSGWAGGAVAHPEIWKTLDYP